MKFHVLTGVGLVLCAGPATCHVEPNAHTVALSRSKGAGTDDGCPANSTILLGTDLVCHNSSHFPVWCDDLAQIPTADAPACCALCAANASAGGLCQAWSYNFQHGLCYMKRRQGKPTNSTDTSGRLLLA